MSSNYFNNLIKLFPDLYFLKILWTQNHFFYVRAREDEIAFETQEIYNSLS